MSCIDQTQTVHSSCQAVPLYGLVASVAKVGLSTVQIIAGLAVGIFVGMAATTAHHLGAHSLRDNLGEIALSGFKHALFGFGSLFYASANLATLGLVGMTVENFTHSLEHRSWNQITF